MNYLEFFELNQEPFSNAPVAHLFVIYATIDPSLGAMGITAFIVERDTPGLNVVRPLKPGDWGDRTPPSPPEDE